MWAAFSLALICILCLQRWLRLRRWSHFEGFGSLSSLPIIGHSYKLNSTDFVETLEEFCRRFGRVFRLDIGVNPSVVLSDFDDINAAYNSEAFNGTHFHTIPFWKDVKGFNEVDRVFGVLTTEGAAWREQRRFMLMQLGEVGLKKADVLAVIIGEEVDKMIAALKLQKGVVNFSRFFLPVTNNIIWRLLTGKVTDVEDPEAKRLALLVGNAFAAMTPSNARHTAQANSNLIYRLSLLLGIPTVLDALNPIAETIADEINFYKGDANADNYIQRNLAEIDAAKPGQVHYGSRGTSHMKGTILDLFIAGTDTTATLMEWTLLYLAGRADLQEKLYEELKDKPSSVTLEDRAEAPWTVAFIEETLRMSPMGSGFAIPHMVTQDTFLRGHFYPKGTRTFPFLKLIHRCEKYFDEPNEFKPERFIDKETGKFRTNKHVMTFSVGKRRCPGEQLGRAEAFLFLASLVKNFTFHPPEDGAEISFDYKQGLVLYPKNAKLRVCHR